MVMLRSTLENRNISCRSHLVYVLLQSILLSACCTNFSTSNGSRGWRPNIVKKQLNLVVLETLVKLMANKAPSMKSSQSFPFSSMPFLRMSSYCFRTESDILSLSRSQRLYNREKKRMVKRKTVEGKAPDFTFVPPFFHGDLRDSRKYDPFSSKPAVLFNLFDKGLTPEISEIRRT